ncbi:MAG: 4Fe-4S dicluster domain-containing protein [Moorellaceae bacterium]
MKKWYMIIDLAKCTGCYNCLLACKDEHVDNEWPGYALPQPRHGHYWINLECRERGQYPLVDISYLPLLCMHCEEAPCIKASKGSVYKRTDGIVIIDPNRAKGQKELVDSCPWGRIFWNSEREVPQKCTFCAHLLDQGWDKTRCAQACPTGALQVRYMEEEERERLIEREKLEVWCPEPGWQAQVYYKHLYLYTRCFIGGSVALRREDGTMDCVEGARVRLLRDRTIIGETITDCFGDFKLDGLPRESGHYTLEIFLEGYPKQRLKVELKESVNVGTIILSPESKM